jgi:hypothetical protein
MNKRQVLSLPPFLAREPRRPINDWVPMVCSFTESRIVPAHDTGFLLVLGHPDDGVYWTIPLARSSWMTRVPSAVRRDFPEPEHGPARLCAPKRIVPQEGDHQHWYLHYAVVVPHRDLQGGYYAFNHAQPVLGARIGGPVSHRLIADHLGHPFNLWDAHDAGATAA